MIPRLLKLPLAAALFLLLARPLQLPAADATAWTWQQPQVAIDPKGDLTWQPHAFVFEHGASLKYIDYAAGNDENAGTKDAPWKHHPWDPHATGLAKACSGIHTYIFKRGITYRGTLLAKESGKAGDPIRLTSDPEWGAGEAVISGAQTVQHWTKGAARKDIPEPEKVWHADLPFAPRALWITGKTGIITRIPLARTPNWKVSTLDDVKSQWWHWDYKDNKFSRVFTENKGFKLHLGIDTVHLTQPAEYYQDAILWTEHGWVAGSPYPVRVETVDTDKKGLGFQGRWGGAGTYSIIRYNRYFLEDKPQYLDDPDGEFWFDKKREGGTLYLRLPADADPASVTVEAAQQQNLIDSTGVNHLHITGLTFRFTNPYWKLEGVPYIDGEKLDTAAIRVLGFATDFRVANCRFEHVTGAVRMKALAVDDAIDQVLLADNDIAFTDRGAFHIAEGSKWGEAERKSGLLYDVKILRNNLRQVGLRPTRFDQSFAIDILNAQTLEVAGNIVAECYGGGINAMCGKRISSLRDCPLSRVLIHHNKVTDSLLSIDDYGGIETWQGGPAYVYNNISGNPGGYRNFYLLKPEDPGTARFGFAYYLDGAFKNYHFNNIAWGKSSDPVSPLGNRAAFQEIFSYQNTFFNNSVYNFVEGTRRQRPEAGRNKYLGNIFQSISLNLFRHGDKLGVDPNTHDAGIQQEQFAHSTNANSHNVLHNIGKTFGTFEPQGGDYPDLKSLSIAYARQGQLAADVGSLVDTPPMKDAANHDFRANPTCPATGVKVFVPWALYGEVGEWNFYHAPGHADQVIDEHWYLTPYHVQRDTYRERPMYPLQTVNVTAPDYVAGELEDWIPGALKLNGKNQYATIANATLVQPFKYDIAADEKAGTPVQHLVVAGEDLKSPQIHHSSFLIEVYFKTEPACPAGIIVEKLGEQAGYSLALDEQGHARFSVKGLNSKAAISGKAKINDGQWHHLIAQADRTNKTLTLYTDGKTDAQDTGPDAAIDLSNPGDLYVGGSPAGRHLAATFDFLRIARGTLADAKTTLAELRAWEFDGPFLRDFADQKPPSPRPAGAMPFVR